MKLIALLRAISGLGRNVTMDYLRTVFEAEGFENVEIVTDSGNVVFDGDEEDIRSLESVIEHMLLDALGYEVATFIRTDAELRNVARHKPFMPATLKNAVSLNVSFFREPLDEKATKKILALKTRTDQFHVRDREIYWLSQTRQSESEISNAVFEVTLGKASTMRGISAIKKMAHKYGPR